MRTLQLDVRIIDSCLYGSIGIDLDGILQFFVYIESFAMVHNYFFFARELPIDDSRWYHGVLFS